MEVYIDILLLENFIVNYFLLFITVKTLRNKVKNIRILLSSILGSLYIFTLFFKELKYLTILPVKLLVAVIMIFIILKGTSFFNIIKGSLIFIIYSMALSGICLFLNTSGVINGLNNVSIINFTYKKLLLALILIFLVINRIYALIQDSIHVEQLIYKIDIIYKDKLFSVNGFLDTGNELREPITNLPVIIIEESVVNGIILNDKEKYYISYKDVSGNLGKLVAFKPNYIVLHENNKIQNKEVIIALTKTKLSSENIYNALLSRGAI